MYPGTYARTQPDKIAIIRPATGDVVTYRDLDDRSNRLAQLLRANGLAPGDHVAIYAENTHVYYDVIWACLRSGLYLTPVNRYLPATEAAYIVDNCDAKALIVSAALPESKALADLATRCTVKLAIGGPIGDIADYEQTVADYPADALDDETLGAFMLYSSGTTGRPKGIRRPLPGTSPALGNPGMQSTSGMFGFNSDTVYLSPAPLYHSAPIGFSSGVIQEGGTVVLMDKFDAETALSYLEAYSVTHSQWVPTMFVRMLKLDAEVRTRYDLSRHRCAIHAAAPCPIDVKRAMIDWWGPIIVEFYSSTELAGFAKIDSEQWLAHPGSVGRSLGTPFHVCDEEGRELPPGEPGLIYGEAPHAVRFAYHKDEGKTSGATHPQQEDWVTVGDIGYLDEDGYLYLTDRKAFMIISGGANIYPQQIEDALALHPAVADVAVIGVPNADLGEEVKAVVEPSPGTVGSPELAQEIMDYVRARLGRQLTPRTVDFVEELPRLPTGKLYKQAVRDRYWPKPAPSVDKVN